MKPLPNDRPDLQRRDRIRDVKRRLADWLRVEPFRIDEILRQAAANPTIDAASIVEDALSNRQAGPRIAGRLFDLQLEKIAELITVIVDERIADELRPNAQSEGSRGQGPEEERDPDNLNAIDAELQAGDGRGDAWEGEE